MLPVVVIGADDSVREALETWDAGTHVLLYDTAEDAEYGLSDLRSQGLQGSAIPSPPERGDDGRWQVTVVYGPKSFGPLVTAGDSARLAHSGWTVLADRMIRDDQAVPRRVRDNQVEGQPTDTLVFEAMARAQANYLLVTGVPGSLDALRATLQARLMP
jgi:hypothetical protein